MPTITITPVFPAAPSGDEAFRLFANISPRANREILAGDTIDVVEHQGLALYFDNFSGWNDNNPEVLWTEIDYGERYNFQFHDTADLLSGQKFLRGTQAGYYPGFASGHAFRGTNMAGVVQLSPAAPTKTQTVTAFVSDGTKSLTLQFSVRVVRQFNYYTDRSKNSYAVGIASPESGRRGIVYVTRDGDFTGAPAKAAGVFHHTLGNGEWYFSTFSGDKRNTHPDYASDGTENPNYGYGSNGITSICILFKGGETFFPAGMQPVRGSTTTVGAWGTGFPIMDTSVMRDWGEAEQTMIKFIFNTNNLYDHRAIIHGIDFKCSDYNVSNSTSREWWNILPYTSKTGTFSRNEVIGNGNGVFTQFLYDTGTSLFVRQVMDSATFYDASANETTFTNGDTITGASSSATMVFNATGSRQNRTIKLPTAFWSAKTFNCTFDGCIIRGAHQATNGLGLGSVISDTKVENYFNYGLFVDSAPEIWFALSGLLITQPTGYVSAPIDTAGGQTVAGNRPDWNTTTELAPVVVENRIRHGALRNVVPGIESFHYCGIHTYGGHGSQHQQGFRMMTDAAGQAQDQIYIVMFGNTMAAGNQPLGWGTFDASAIPRTPRAILLDSNHFLATSIFRNGFTKFRTNSTTVRNNLFEMPTGVTVDQSTDLTLLFWEDDPTHDGAADVDARNSVVEFNTFVVRSDGLSAFDVAAQDTSLRGGTNNVIWRNNVYIIDTAKVGTIASDRLALNEALADFNTDYKPGVDAGAYQDATGFIPRVDANGNTRPASLPSRGAFEPQ